MIRILIIEDTQELLEEIADWLTLEGYDVVTASDGRDGIDQAFISEPDLIISDISMPLMSGHDVLAAVQRDIRLASVPFIFLTAHGDMCRGSAPIGHNWDVN